MSSTASSVLILARRSGLRLTIFSPSLAFLPRRLRSAPVPPFVLEYFFGTSVPLCLSTPLPSISASFSISSVVDRLSSPGLFSGFGFGGGVSIVSGPSFSRRSASSGSMKFCIPTIPPATFLSNLCNKPLSFSAAAVFSTIVSDCSDNI